MRRKQTALLLLLPLLLSGCVIRAAGEASTPPAGSFEVYYAMANNAPGGQAVDFEYRVPPAGTDLISGLVTLLLGEPNSVWLQSPLQGKRVSLLSQQLDDGQLTLDLSEAYGSLTGIDLTVASYCFALTLCQLEQVTSVRLTVQGQPLAPGLSNQQLKAEDVLLSGTEETPLTLDAVLWFARADGTGLGTEELPLVKAEGETPAQAVLDALLRGPSSAALRPLIPPDTAVRSVRVEKATCYIDFSAAFLTGLPHDPVQTKLVLHSIVNTLTSSLDAVESVQIKVEGAALPLSTTLPSKLEDKTGPFA